MRSSSLCLKILSRLSTGPEWDRPVLPTCFAKKISESKWPLASKDDYGLICGFCPLAMPSAASQLISLNLFSSGQRNGFDLASSCYGSFSLLVGYDLLCLSLSLCWSSWGVSIQKPGVFFSLISHYLRNLCFVPPSLRTKGNADGSFCSGQLESSKDAEKRSGGLVIAWAHPESSAFLCLVLLPQLITCPHFMSCSMQCQVYSMMGTCRAHVI